MTNTGAPPAGTEKRDTHCVYIVGPDPCTAQALATLLGHYGIEVRAYASATGFLQACANPASLGGCVLVTDNLPDMDSLAMVRELHRQGLCLAVVDLSDDPGADFRAEALRAGATEVLARPLMGGFLLARLRELLPLAGEDATAPPPDTRQLYNGTPVTFRVMRPDDEPLEKAFIDGLSLQSKHSRFFLNIKQLPPALMNAFTHPDYPRSCAFIATVGDGDSEQQIGVARYMPTETAGTAEFAVVVADAWQGCGIATQLLRGLTTAAAIAGIKRLQGLMLRDNKAMHKLAQAQGYTITRDPRDAGLLLVTRTLKPTC